jgi:hypothetical protein
VTLCAEVVQDDCVASPQGWPQRLGPIGAEPLPRHGSVQEGGRAPPARAQGGDDGESCPGAVRKRDAAAFTGARPERRAMLVGAPVLSRNTSRSGSRSSGPANPSSRAVLTSSRSCSAACVALFGA